MVAQYHPRNRCCAEAAQGRRGEYPRLCATFARIGRELSRIRIFPIPHSGDEDDRRAAGAPESTQQQHPSLSPIAQGQPDRTRAAIRRKTPNGRTVRDTDANGQWSPRSIRYPLRKARLNRARKASDGPGGTAFDAARLILGVLIPLP